MWAQIAKTTQVNASKTQLRHGHSDGSQYPPTSLVLNEHHFVSFSVAIVDASTSQLLLVESDVESGDLYLLEGELESHHASISEAALQACRQQAHAEVRIDGVLCVQSYVRSLKNTYLRFLVLASASAQSIIESSSQRWVPLSCIASQPLRSSDFVPYLAWHLETGLVSSINLAQPCQPTPLVVCVSAAAASPSSSVYIRVVVAHRTRGQVLVVGPFPEASSSSNRALDSAYSASATWLLPLTHQDVRGGDTPSFAAQRLMMAAWALQVNVVGLMAVDFCSAGCLLTLLALTNQDPPSSPPSAAAASSAEVEADEATRPHAPCVQTAWMWCPIQQLSHTLDTPSLPVAVAYPIQQLDAVGTLWLETTDTTDTTEDNTKAHADETRAFSAPATPPTPLSLPLDVRATRLAAPFLERGY